MLFLSSFFSFVDSSFEAAHIAAIGNRDRGSSRGGHGNEGGGIDVDRRTDSSNINNNK